MIYIIKEFNKKYDNVKIIKTNSKKIYKNIIYNLTYKNYYNFYNNNYISFKYNNIVLILKGRTNNKELNYIKNITNNFNNK